MKKYFPIVVSRKGEHDALSHLSDQIKNEISPIVQVINDRSPKKEAIKAAKVRKRPSAERELSVITGFMDWNFDGNELYLDFSIFSPFDYSQVDKIITDLTGAGVNIVPVVDRNSPVQYLDLLRRHLSRNNVSNICVRVSNSTGLSNAGGVVKGVMKELNMDVANVSLLFDLGFIQSHNDQLLAEALLSALNVLHIDGDLKEIIVASGSFPDGLGDKGRGQFNLKRYEWGVWKFINEKGTQRGELKYGDYGIRNPKYEELPYSGACAIKYTTVDDYEVYRGTLAKTNKIGGRQYIELAADLIRGPHYMGHQFSWGDDQINEYARKNAQDANSKPGSSTTWVSIGQNHHITLLHSLL